MAAYLRTSLAERKILEKLYDISEFLYDGHAMPAATKTSVVKAGEYAITARVLTLLRVYYMQQKYSPVDIRKN